MGDNIKMDIKEIWCEGVDWILIAHDRVQLFWGGGGSCEHCNLPDATIKTREFLD
jgi:hypothetical protein